MDVGAHRVRAASKSISVRPALGLGVKPMREPSSKLSLPGVWISMLLSSVCITNRSSPSCTEIACQHKPLQMGCKLKAMEMSVS